MRVLHRDPPVDLAAAAEAAARSGFPAVSLRGVGKRYGEGPTAVDALAGVDLEVWPGEFVVLLGPSGSGKTTLLNLVGGIEEATSGTVTIAGTDVAGLRGEQLTIYRRDPVGFVFQFFNLVPTLTALENVQRDRTAGAGRAAVVGVMLAFAVVMAAALLLNAMSANVAERSVELGTLVIIVRWVLAAALVAQLPVLRRLRNIDVARIVGERAL